MALPKVEQPKHLLTVPSTGEQIEFRPYVVKEEKILMMAMESTDQAQMIRSLKDVIEACTYNKIKVDKLAPFDLEYLFLKIRAKAVGEASKINVKCSKCEQSNEIELNVENIEVKGNIKKNEKVMLDDSLGLVLRYPSVRGLQANLDKKKKNPNQADVIVSTIAASIESIFNDEGVWPADDQTTDELVDFVESLPSEMFKKLSTFFEDMPSLREDINFNCESCGENNHVTLEGLQSFF